jgi:hypothetical protein
VDAWLTTYLVLRGIGATVAYKGHGLLRPQYVDSSRPLCVDFSHIADGGHYSCRIAGNPCGAGFEPVVMTPPATNRPEACARLYHFPAGGAHGLVCG